MYSNLVQRRTAQPGAVSNERCLRSPHSTLRCVLRSAAPPRADRAASVRVANSRDLSPSPRKRCEDAIRKGPTPPAEDRARFWGTLTQFLPGLLSELNSGENSIKDHAARPGAAHGSAARPLGGPHDRSARLRHVWSGAQKVTFHCALRGAPTPRSHLHCTCMSESAPPAAREAKALLANQIKSRGFRDASSEEFPPPNGQRTPPRSQNTWKTSPI